MNGGTYARALEAGFSQKQAVFFANLGADTRQEAVDASLKEFEKKAPSILFKGLQSLLIKILPAVLLLAVGATIGVLL